MLGHFGGFTYLVIGKIFSQLWFIYFCSWANVDIVENIQILKTNNLAIWPHWALVSLKFMRRTCALSSRLFALRFTAFRKRRRSRKRTRFNRHWPFQYLYDCPSFPLIGHEYIVSSVMYLDAYISKLGKVMEWY